jgi:Zn-dependent M32 family carboxypeptidase
LYENESDLYACLKAEHIRLAKNQAFLVGLKKVKAEKNTIDQTKNRISECKKTIRQLKKFVGEIAIANLNFD